MATSHTGTTTFIRKIAQLQQTGLFLVIFVLCAALTLFSGSHVDPQTGATVNNFLNYHTLLQTATDASFFAIMAVGATMVIISCGIDLSVGSIFALSGVAMAMALRSMHNPSAGTSILIGASICVAVGLACGILNGALVVGLKVHPFIITLGTMWILRGIAFVASKAESILVPQPMTEAIRASLFMPKTLSPIPAMAMVIIAIIGAVYLQKAVAGRHIFAVGGNSEASRYAGLHINRVLIGIYAICGLTAGIAAFLGVSYYGSASCGDATGYELYVIASAVVGGASLTGGKGNAINAMLGAILITLIRQSIRTMHFDQNYEWIIIGIAIIVAVVLDQASSSITAKRIVSVMSKFKLKMLGATILTGIIYTIKKMHFDQKYGLIIFGIAIIVAILLDQVISIAAKWFKSRGKQSINSKK